jgi:hypothetical protein
LSCRPIWAGWTRRCKRGLRRRRRRRPCRNLCPRSCRGPVACRRRCPRSARCMHRCHRRRSRHPARPHPHLHTTHARSRPRRSTWKRSKTAFSFCKSIATVCASAVCTDGAGKGVWGHPSRAGCVRQCRIRRTRPPSCARQRSRGPQRLQSMTSRRRGSRPRRPGWSAACRRAAHHRRGRRCAAHGPY